MQGIHIAGSGVYSRLWRGSTNELSNEESEWERRTGGCELFIVLQIGAAWTTGVSAETPKCVDRSIFVFYGAFGFQELSARIRRLKADRKAA
ncbi:unnamed protein product, partial [Iphiclides podalirius]